MPEKTKTPKYEQLRQSLLASIRTGRYPVGSRFPSIKATSLECNASYVTTQRAYRLLVEDGVLSTGSGLQGTLVIASDKRPARPRQSVVTGVFRPLRQRNVVDNFAIDMLEGVCQTLASRKTGILYHRTGADRQGPLDAVDKALDDLRGGSAQGVVLDQILPDEELRKFEEAGCPAVLLNRHSDSVAIDSAAPDMEWIGRETGRRALAAGYERIAVGLMWRPQADDSPFRRVRARFYSDYVKGIEESVFPSEAVSRVCDPPPSEAEGYGVDDNVFARVLGVPDAPGGRRTLYVCLHDSLALRMRRVLGERGFETPRDAGVIGLVDAECNRNAAAPVTTWRIDPDEIGRAAAEMLLDRLEFPSRPCSRRYMKPLFMDHGTL